jgi:predicted O-methyltransferase YrrM
MSEDITESGSKFLHHVGRSAAGLGAGFRRRLMRRVGHLAEKAGVVRGHRQVISGASPEVAAQMTLSAADAGGPVGAVIQRAMALPGWCSIEKASLIAELVRAERPKICVEIGIFGGRSLVPCAAALRENDDGGAIYGIETWSAAVATEHVTNKENDEWWRNLDYADIKSEFLKFLVANKLVGWVRLIEAPSADAIAIFRSIDYLHIDGAHSIFNAAEDVVLYFKRLKPGGIIIMDDVNWETTAPAYQILKALCDPIATVKDEATGLDACAILRKRRQ